MLKTIRRRKQSPEVFYKKTFFLKISKFTGKHVPEFLCKLRSVTLKEGTLGWACEFCKNFMKTFLTERLQVHTSIFQNTRTLIPIKILLILIKEYLRTLLIILNNEVLT